MRIDKRSIRSSFMVFTASAVLCLFVFMGNLSADVSNGIKTIKAVEATGLERLTRKEFLDMMCLKRGDLVDAEVLRKCIRRAFMKGIFLDIQVDTERSDEGITLRYIVEEVPVINEIKITGNSEISSRKIKKLLPFEEGDDLRENYFKSAKKVIKDSYIRKGFNGISVDLSAGGSSGTSGLVINIDIHEGEQQVVDNIDMPEDALGRVDIDTGRAFDMDKIDKELNKLKEDYIEEGYIRPEIGPYELIDHTLYIPVRAGVKLSVEFRDNTVFSDKKLMKEMPFQDNGMVTDELVEEASGRLRDLYLSRGYYYVQIAAGLETSGENTTVKFIIFEGKKVKLRKVNFSGSSIDHDVLIGVTMLDENEEYNDNQPERSIGLLENFYNALGYINMNVVDLKKEFESDGAEIDLTFDIDEGEQVRIKELRISGSRDLSVSEIKNTANLRRHMPFNLVDIGDARYRVLSLYKRYGYVDASVDIKSEINAGSAVIQFTIDEGLPSVLGKVIIRGDRKTKEKIIRREFTLDEGAPYNHEELLNIKQRIYKLGIFNEVSIEELALEEQPYKTVRDVIVTVEEDKPGSVEVLLGYGDYEQFRASLDLTYRNLGGYDREVSLRGELSSVEKRYILNFIEPWLFNKRNLPFTASLIKEEKENVNIDTRDVLYKIDRLSVITGVERELSSRLKANLNYEFSVNKTTDVDPGVILSKEDTGSVAIGSISASLFYDTRDNPFDPSSGSINGIVLKFASKAFLSEVEFIKATLQSSWYYHLGKGIVFATSLKGGASFTYQAVNELPLVERFFLGGRTTVRGYRHDNLGPKGVNDVPTGGNVYALINEEFRFNVGKGVGVVLFLDGGNIWQTIDDVDDRLKFTVGTGLRYNTPVGPVRVDYGHKLNREKSESAGEIHFSFGHAF